MAVYRRGNTWWYEFTFASRRVRESAKTSRKTIAVEAEKRRRLELERALAGIPSERPQDRIQTVTGVLDAYRAAYKVNHRQKSIAVVEERSAHVKRLLGNVLLPDVTQDRVLKYMQRRQSEGASNRTINMDLAVLSRAMGQTWRVLWPQLKKLEENHDAGIALEADQEKAILDAAMSNRSPLIYPHLVLLAWTGMRCDEARTLRWSRLNLASGEVIVSRSKSEAGRGRSIPLAAPVIAALEHHAAWYEERLGEIQPEHYVFPKMRRIRPVDATQPVTSLKRSWETVRTEAKVQCRLHDLRHSFCTKLGEAGVPEQTMLDIMGHVSATMLRRYSHIRAQARREAIDALEARTVSTGVPTKSSTVAREQPKAKSATH